MRKGEHGMSKQRERDEFIMICAREKIPLGLALALLRYTKILQIIAELECSSEAADRDRVPCPASKHMYIDCCCDFGYQNPGMHSDVPRVTAQSKRIEYKV